MNAGFAAAASRTTCLLILVAGTARADDVLLPLDVVFAEPTTYSYQLNPDAELLAAYVNFNSKRQLLLMDTSRSDPHMLMDFSTMEDVWLHSYGWVDNDTLYIDFSSKRDSGRLAFIDVALTNNQLDTTVKRVKDEGVLLDAIPGREDMIFFARKVRDSSSRFRLYTLTVDQLVDGDFSDGLEFRNPLEGAINYWRDANTGSLLAATYDSGSVRHWFLGNSSDQWVEYFSSNPLEFEFRPVAILSNGKLAVLSNRDTNLLSLIEFDMATGEFGGILYQHDRYDLTSADVSSVTGDLRSVSYTDHGVEITEYMAASDSRLLEILERTFPGKQARIISGGEGSRKKVVQVSASDDPGRFYLLDAETRDAELLTSRRESVDDYTLARAEVFTVEADGGVDVEAIVTRPAKPNGVLLVNPHGGPVGVRDYAIYDPEIQFLANRGYTVLQVNFRGSRGFGREFLETGRGQFGQRIEDDISRAVEALMARESFDSVCSIGASYGGYSAVMLAIRQPELYACVIGIFGIYDLPYLFNTSNFALLEDYRRAVAHVVGEYSDALVDVSPLYLAEALEAPLLLIAGDEDRIADYEHSNRLKYRLEQLGKPVEFYFYEGVGHGHHNWNGDRHQFALIDDYIRRQLGLPVPAAANADAVLADGYHRIAAYHADSDYSEHDSALVLRYLNRAADLGNAAALSWLGSLYENGRGVTKDFQTAVGHYQQAARLGSSSASFRLAELYRDGAMDPLANTDAGGRAFELFTQADEQGHKYARYEMARALCTADGIDRDVDRSLALVALTAGDKPDADERRVRNRVFGNLLWDESIPADARRRIADLVRDETGSDYQRLGIIGLRNGVLTGYRQFRNRTIELVDGTRFGVIFRVHKGRTDTDRKDGYVVKVRWTGPPTMNDGKGYREEFIDRIFDDQHIQFTYELQHDWEMVPGHWRLQIATLADEILVDESFVAGN